MIIILFFKFYFIRLLQFALIIGFEIRLWNNYIYILIKYMENNIFEDKLFKICFSFLIILLFLIFIFFNFQFFLFIYDYCIYILFYKIKYLLNFILDKIKYSLLIIIYFIFLKKNKIYNNYLTIFHLFILFIICILLVLLIKQWVNYNTFNTNKLFAKDVIFNYSLSNILIWIWNVWYILFFFLIMYLNFYFIAQISGPIIKILKKFAKILKRYRKFVYTLRFVFLFMSCVKYLYFFWVIILTHNDIIYNINYVFRFLNYIIYYALYLVCLEPISVEVLISSNILQMCILTVILSLMLIYLLYMFFFNNWQLRFLGIVVTFLLLVFRILSLDAALLYSNYNTLNYLGFRFKPNFNN